MSQWGVESIRITAFKVGTSSVSRFAVSIISATVCNKFTCEECEKYTFTSVTGKVCYAGRRVGETVRALCIAHDKHFKAKNASALQVRRTDDWYARIVVASY